MTHCTVHGKERDDTGWTIWFFFIRRGRGRVFGNRACLELFEGEGGREGGALRLITPAWRRKKSSCTPPIPVIKVALIVVIFCLLRRRDRR